MSISNKEKMLADALSKAFEKFATGDSSGARQQAFLIKHNLKVEAEEIRKILRRIRLD